MIVRLLQSILLFNLALPVFADGVASTVDGPSISGAECFSPLSDIRRPPNPSPFFGEANSHVGQLDSRYYTKLAPALSRTGAMTGFALKPRVSQSDDVTFLRDSTNPNVVYLHHHQSGKKRVQEQKLPPPDVATSGQELDLKQWFHLLNNQYPDDDVRLIEQGGWGMVVALEGPSGRRVKKKALKVSYATQKMFRQEIKAHDLLVNKYKDEAHKYFIEFKDADLNHPLPEIDMVYKDGALVDHLHRFHTRGGGTFEDSIALMRHLATAVKMMHDAGLTHNDIKPDNILVDIDAFGRVIRVVLTDFGIVKPMNELGDRPETLGGTWAYLRPHKNGDNMRKDDEKFFSFRHKDMYALMVTGQDVVLGRRPTRAETNGYDDNFSLKKSPHSLDPEVSEVLSTLVWTEFDTADEMIHAFNQAEKYKLNPSAFYSQYYGPEILANRKRDPEVLGKLISGDDALLNRFLGERPLLDLGISQEIYNQISPHVTRPPAFVPKPVTPPPPLLSVRNKSGMDRALQTGRILFKKALRILRVGN